MRRTLTALVVAAGLLVVPAAAAQAATAGHAASAAYAVKTVTTIKMGKAAKYKNCTAMHKKYAGGVAKSSKVHNTKTVAGHKVRATSAYKPKVSAALYAANKGLDRDKDGIACEK